MLIRVVRSRLGQAKTLALWLSRHLLADAGKRLVVTAQTFAG